MSRIQQILDKAEREGRMRRTTGLAEPGPGAQPATPHAASPHTASRAVGTHTAAIPPPARADLGLSHAPAIEPLRPVTTALPSPVVAPARPTDARLHPLVVAALRPHSTPAEQFRALRTRLAQMEDGHERRALIVTSGSQGDGKTLTAMNLALAMAQEHHRRVLLLDADLRGGTVHRLLGIPGRPGLSDVLLGTTALDQAMVAVPQLRLTVIPAGSAVDQPTELLGSAEMRRVLDVLRTQFDRIVLDTPPAAPLADVGVLTPMVDGVVLVVRAGWTPRPAIDRAIEDIEESKLLGLVLNDVEEDRAAQYGYGYGRPTDTASRGPRLRTSGPGGDTRSR